jgi:D-alanine transaminase
MNPYPSKVYLNGEIIATESAKISVFDRGFIFGDGIYEAMVQINGKFFYENAHYKRLDYCLKEVQIDFEVGTLRDEIPKLLKDCDLVEKDCFLYIQITRGKAPRKHSFPKNIAPTVFMYALPKQLPDISSSVNVVTQPETRWLRCDLKMTSLMGNILANEHAMNNNVYETLFVRDGIITEASHCNVFFVKENVVYTHLANKHILNGITRQVVLELCEKLGIEYFEKGIAYNDVTNMDEAFITGTSTQIAAVKQLDDHMYFEGDSIGAITRKLQLGYLELKKAKVR